MIDRGHVKGEKYRKLSVSDHFWITGTLIGIGLFAFIHAIMFQLWAWCAVGAFLWVIAFILTCNGFGFYSVKVTPIEETKEYVALSKGANYALKMEMEKKYKILQKLQKEQGEAMKFYVYGLVLICIGIFPIIWNFKYLRMDIVQIFQGWTSLGYLFILIGIAMIVAGVRMLWFAFVNSELTMSLRISDWLSLDTIPMKIWRENILLGVISERIEEEKRAGRYQDNDSILESAGIYGPELSLDKLDKII